MPRMTEEQRQALLKQYVAGVPVAQIAYDFNVSQSYPSQLAARYNIRRGTRQYARERAAETEPAPLADVLVDDVAAPSPATNVSSVAEIRRLAAMGKGRTAIAALLRCPYRVVDEALA
jgi:hypothetical protein